MADMKNVSQKSVYMGRLPHGGDLLEELTTICRDRQIQCGRVEAIGAVQKACIGYYDQNKWEYQFHTLNQAMEILKLSGNISLKEGAPMVHAHITLADGQGRAFGGHLAPGTIIFACECIIEVFDSSAFNRVYDEETGLPLWGSSS
jgi:hypothetical protein